MDRLITKVVDNIQLTIKNIHIRYEDRISIGSDSPFSLGFTLKELSVNTTNKEWQSAFFDRLLAENKDKPIYKRLKVDNFAFYLLVGDNSLLSENNNNLNYNASQLKQLQYD